MSHNADISPFAVEALAGGGPPPDPWGLRIPPVTLAEGWHPDEHLLLWQALGSCAYRCGRTELTLRERHALWIPAGVRHSLTVQEDSVTLPMWFPVAGTATTLTSVTAVPVDGPLRRLVLALVQTQYTALVPEVNLRRQILALLERTPEAPAGLTLPVTPAARAVAEGWRFNPGDDRRMAQWAAATRTSERSLERAFLRETGFTPQQWRLRCRMEAAARLLDRRSPVSAVAHRVGYENHSAFGRAFKAHFGVPPRTWAARAR